MSNGGDEASSMNKQQKIAFAGAFTVFCVGATSFLYRQGALVNLSLGGAAIFTISYLVVGYFLYRYIKSNPDQVDKWFK